jgi:hypothetical protein
MSLSYVFVGVGVAIVFSSDPIVDRLLVIIRNGGRISRVVIESIFQNGVSMLQDAAGSPATHLVITNFTRPVAISYAIAANVWTGH